jgi:hypothetical protein
VRQTPFRLIAAVASLVVLVSSPAAAVESSDQAATDTRAFVEWALGFTLDPATLQALRAGTATDMARDPAMVQGVVQEMDDVMAWVRTHPPADRTLLRSLIEPQLIAAWQADTGASSDTSRRLIAAWRAHNRIIAGGTPPLRRSVVDAYLAMFEFLSKQTGKPVPAEVANHAQFAQRVAAQYTAAPPAMQMQFNEVQPLWLAMQMLWAQSTPAQQAALRAQLRSAAPVAAGPTSAPARTGLGGQTLLLGRYKEHLFVQQQARVWMSTWTNPFSH